MSIRVEHLTGALQRVRPYHRKSGRTMRRTSIAGGEAVNLSGTHGLHAGKAAAR